MSQRSILRDVARQPMGQEPRCPKGCPAPAPASWLQLQTTKKAQVSDALKTCGHEAGPGAELAQSLGLVERVFSAHMGQATLLSVSNPPPWINFMDYFQ